MTIVCSHSCHSLAALDHQSRAASTQQPVVERPSPGAARSATGREPLADDRSSRGLRVKESTRQRKWDQAQAHCLSQRASATRLPGLEGAARGDWR